LTSREEVQKMIEAKNVLAHHPLAAGSYFVFQGFLHGVLITYLSEKELKQT